MHLHEMQAGGAAARARCSSSKQRGIRDTCKTQGDTRIGPETFRSRGFLSSRPATAEQMWLHIGPGQWIRS